MKNCNIVLTKKQQKYQHYHPGKLININFLKVKKYCHLIKEEEQNQLSLHILLFVNDLKNKEKRLKIKEKNK